jgi:hypothetical protein
MSNTRFNRLTVKLFTINHKDSFNPSAPEMPTLDEMLWSEQQEDTQSQHHQPADQLQPSPFPFL